MIFFSEFEDHISVNSQSDSEFEDEDKTDLELAPKQACQQPASEPPQQTFMEAISQQAAHQQVEKYGCQKKMVKLNEWSPCPKKEPCHSAVSVTRMQPGPTQRL